MKSHVVVKQCQSFWRYSKYFDMQLHRNSMLHADYSSSRTAPALSSIQAEVQWQQFLLQALSLLGKHLPQHVRCHAQLSCYLSERYSPGMHTEQQPVSPENSRTDRWKIRDFSGFLPDSSWHSESSHGVPTSQI